MKQIEITVARLYLTEGEKQLDALLKRLRDWEKLRGVTVFRGISGFGDSGVIHNASLLDLSVHLPIVVEFFDTPEKIDAVIGHLERFIKPGHMVSWSARMSVADD